MKEKLKEACNKVTPSLDENNRKRLHKLSHFHSSLKRTMASTAADLHT